jgi:hypothetical protein
MAQSISSNRKTAQQSSRAAAEDLAGEIATLDTLAPAALLQEWKALFGSDPSPLLARIFMVRAIAYRLQERRYGGLNLAQSLRHRRYDFTRMQAHNFRNHPVHQLGRRRPREFVPQTLASRRSLVATILS